MVVGGLGPPDDHGEVVLLRFISALKLVRPVSQLSVAAVDHYTLHEQLRVLTGRFGLSQELHVPLNLLGRSLQVF